MRLNVGSRCEAEVRDNNLKDSNGHLPNVTLPLLLAEK